jgi:hypothetical protein
VAFRPETWAAFGRVLHPGAFGMAFASTRGFHRMAVAIEDAGFIIHPVIMAWGFGQGFPKATQVKYAICQCNATSEHDLSGMPETDLSETEPYSEIQNHNVQQDMQQPSQSTAAARQSSRQGQLGCEEWIMEGRSDLPQSTRQLCVSAVCEMPDSSATDGTQGWVRNGASASDGPNVRLSTHSNGSGTPRRSQPPEQSAGQPRTMAGQSQPQDVGTRQHCGRCGLPIVNPFAGHRYGLQALKPALEPIIVFQKPYQGRPIDCITRTGAGAINIDAGRIGSDERTYQRSGAPGGNAWRLDGMDGRDTDNAMAYGEKSRAMPAAEVIGRWPSNLILSHHPECNGHCVELCPVKRLGEQSGESNSTKLNTIQQARTPHAKGAERERTRVDEGFDDSGTAARYFYNADWMAERLEDSDPLLYYPKASTAEREAGLDDFEAITIDDGREKSIDNAYQRGETTRKNPHPTVKNLSVARHLATLLLPPAEYGPRRLFVPFAGVASEMIGGMLAGWEDVQGVELEADHIPVAEARLAYWQARKGELASLETPIKVKAAAPVADDQLTLF